MPAHFSHLLFAEEALGAADLLDIREVVRAHHSFFVLGAQGPDLFLHNQATEPSSFSYGKLLHRKGYGSYCAALADCIVDRAESVAYLTGFVTHAALDRATHPYIVYHSGWVDPEKPETEKYRGCHAVLERLLDVAMIRKRAPDTNMDFLRQVSCGDKLPSSLVTAIVESLVNTFPDDVLRDLDMRVENAYQDCLFFYRLTNPTDRVRILEELYRRDRSWSFEKRLCALLHPSKLPSIDVLNRKHRKWFSPANAEHASTASFVDLYEEAISKASSCIAALDGYMGQEIGRQDFVAAIGNGSLDNDSGRGEPLCHEVCKPLPIPEYIEQAYRQIEKELGLNQSWDLSSQTPYRRGH